MAKESRSEYQANVALAMHKASDSQQLTFSERLALLINAQPISAKRYN